ncbi:hypothetical protein M378DRAFT_167606 [Amanita muscaria Koide BX008]|uniref:Secreted protein n=1 Tax=Amanita muscaria (strain Koide BX008) TaxID=946122 RepID=A0A0C2SD51_AMAMK|nr:hypothetical protein M378DRAFT_167606 [Amanita muscaria Koide BX008]
MVGFIFYCMLPFELLATGPNYMPPTPSVTSSSYHTPESRQALKAAQRRRLRPRAIEPQCKNAFIGRGWWIVGVDSGLS